MTVITSSVGRTWLLSGELVTPGHAVAAERVCRGPGGPRCTRRSAGQAGTAGVAVIVVVAHPDSDVEDPQRADRSRSRPPGRRARGSTPRQRRTPRPYYAATRSSRPSAFLGHGRGPPGIARLKTATQFRVAQRRTASPPVRGTTQAGADPDADHNHASPPTSQCPHLPRGERTGRRGSLTGASHAP